jgi:20S proteasome alpha/beta subunit
MTIIVGYKDAKTGTVYIAGDTQGTSGWDARHRADGKVFIKHGILYGFTSSYRMGQILKYHSEDVESPLLKEDTFGYVVSCLVPMWRKILAEHHFTKTESGVDTGGVFVVAVNGRLFVIESDFQVAEHADNFCAVGCGDSYAMGSMYSQDLDKPAKDIITEAIDAAIYFSAGCGGNIEVVMSVADGEVRGND